MAKKELQKSLSIIHFFPIEKYPPVMNLIKILNRKKDKLTVNVLTTNTEKVAYETDENINYKRTSYSFDETKFPILSFLKFSLIALIELIKTKPTTVLYYETVSSFAALLYINYFNKNCKLYIHFHEYTPKEDYLKQFFFWKLIYRLEQKNLKNARWISHTNENRMKLFLKDNDIEQNKENHKICPNYPLASWQKKRVEKNEHLKLVYIGHGADEKTTFVRELVQWLAKQSRKTEFDIYCFQKESVPNDLLGTLGNTKVSVKNSLSYYELPNVLTQYNIGLVLYKGLTTNYTYNAPNKLFEYLSCGLDVWYPSVMIEPGKYKSESKPKVIELDFDNMQYDIEKLLKAEGEKWETKFNAESVYEPLIKSIES